jgi:GNAT superfamily N-acetyltransferase
MAATVWVGDESGQTVQWGSAYVRPDYRRTGIGTWIYQARERWSIAAGFTAAMIPIRADNLRSTEIHLSQGAIYVAGDVRRFADGSHAMVRWYRREL